jgi:carbonic anhydrase
VISAQEALARLREGNRRFVESHQGPPARPSASQEPFAIILGCSDARVPAELVFGQGFGDLFVIRVAGNIVAPSQVGSVELAAELFNIRLALVLGHSECGAVKATLQALRQPTGTASPGLRAIADRIRPAVEPLLASHKGQPESDLIAAAVRANVRASVDQLRHGSTLLERHIDADGLRVVGAEYRLETGAVEFFDGAPIE